MCQKQLFVFDHTWFYAHIVQYVVLCDGMQKTQALQTWFIALKAPSVISLIYLCLRNRWVGADINTEEGGREKGGEGGRRKGRGRTN